MNVYTCRHDLETVQKLQVMLQTKRMPVNKYNNGSPMTPKTTRLERLLRERELRKSSRNFQQSDEPRDSNKEAELLNDSRLVEGDIWALPKEEDFYDVNAFADGCQWQDGRPRRQRLLVVANRLPVSATRKGEDSWQLEMSVGGLVTALLG